jgi:hypothetical protein
LHDQGCVVGRDLQKKFAENCWRELGTPMIAATNDWKLLLLVRVTKASRFRHMKENVK